MEALAAVGLASNILQLIECGYKVIVMAKELHESGQDATYADENAAFVAQEMQELSLRVMKQLPASDLTDDEKALCLLARNCSQLCNKLLVLLDDLKIKKPGRKLDIVTGVLRNMRKRKERDQLQANLDNYRQQLNIQINSMSRSDLVRRLEDTLRTTSMTQQDILYLRDDVQRLQRNSRLDSVNMSEFFHKLQEAIETPLQHFAILQSLRDPQMHDRFENVDTAHQRTFEWLLRGPEHSQIDGETGVQFQKHKEFVTWLQEDIVSLPTDVPRHSTGSKRPSSDSSNKRSIFRIAGKPGAGKSTLMKFICQNEATFEKLKSWSGEKQLICAKAFFWRLGNDEQKNLAGLTKCLLYQILKTAPGIIPNAFPLETTNRVALNNLMRSGRAFEKHKMIFFIDGLDEFDGRPFELIQEIIGWTTYGNNDLKICVSSRQWNEFEIGFEEYPNLRIHEWTHGDIKTFVTERFDEIGDLSTLVDKHDLETLAETVVIKAEGVFLWVRVVLATIEQGVLNGDDFGDLQAKVAAFPSELKDLYQYLFDLIPDYDRRKALETLYFAFYREMPLLQYKFLGDLSKNPDFATELSMDPLPEEDLRRCLINTSRQINGRCKGFLEISPAKRECYSGDAVVKFMHTTVAEFLCQPNIRKITKSHVDGVHLFDRLCQTFIALAKSIDTDQFYSAGLQSPQSLFDMRCLFILKLDRILNLFVQPRHFAHREPRSTSRFLDFLDKVDAIVIQRLPKRVKSGHKIQLQNYIAYRNVTVYPTVYLSQNWLWISEAQLVKVMAAGKLVFEYFTTDEHCNLRTLHQADPPFMNHIVNATFSGISDMLYSPRAFRMLETLFQVGVSPSVQVERREKIGEASQKYELWGWILQRLFFLGLPLEKLCGKSQLYQSEKGWAYRLIELCLRYGAVEDFSLVFGPCYEVTGANQLIIEVTTSSLDGQHILKEEQTTTSNIDYQLDIVRYARTKNGVLTFRDLLAYCFPHHCDRLYALLDKKGSVSPTTEAAESCTPAPVMPILFPEENRYGSYPVSMGADKQLKKGKRCLVHSEKCFEDFEARIQGKGPGHVNRDITVCFGDINAQRRRK
ncbi:hypothetical protein F4781DRAFT_416893 [Annulohypoxylon bovei var. microspora]|nr:hypothetical protein F4781DRAFT_416893 [Annulohypoxylon bovei var. microspora]